LPRGEHYSLETDHEIAHIPEIDGIPSFILTDDEPKEVAIFATRGSAAPPVKKHTLEEWHHIMGHADPRRLKEQAKVV
jgi:hypothetical protein